MQNDTTSSTANGATSTISSSPLKSQPQSNDVGYASLYSAIFDPKPSLAPYDTESDSDATLTRRQHKLYHSVLVQDHQEMVNRHSLCLKRLLEAAEEADSLRRENNHLRTVNLELNKNLSLLIHTSLQKQFGSSSASASVQRTPFGIVNALRGLSIDEKGDEEVSDESPTSVIESEDTENADVERFSLPKSISVRSNGYVKGAQAGASNAAARTRTVARPRTATTFNASSQKVYVRGGVKQEEPLELEVYNQGMFKTELCNKWQECGACPYEDHCQFAHGIEELRPVIRHPRYKTEVCRMVLSGVVCPYGHRCHFRHALTDEEKFMGHNKPRPLKLDR